MRDRVWSLLTANVGTKLISLAIAIVLWVIVMGSRSVEVTKEVPLEIITPPDLIVGNEIPDKIQFRLSGPKAFLRAIVDRREDPIRVNLAGAKPGVITYRFFSDNIRVPIGVKVLSVNPTAILIKLEFLRRRELPVKLELRGLPAEGFHLVKAEVKPAWVRVRGSESHVNQLTEIPSMPIDLSDLKQSVEKELILDSSRFILQVEGPLPRVFLTIEPISPNFRIKNVDVRVLSSFQYSIDEKVKTITVLVRASSAELRTLDRSKIYGVIDLRGRAKGKYREAVKLTLPDAISLVRTVPDRLNITLF